MPKLIKNRTSLLGPAVALLAGAAVLTACGSSGGSGGGAGGGGVFGGGGSVPAGGGATGAPTLPSLPQASKVAPSVSVSLPSVTLPSVTLPSVTLPAAGSSSASSPFCAAYDEIGAADASGKTGRALAKAVGDAYRDVLAVAPAALRSDLTYVVSVFDASAAGRPNTDYAKLKGALDRVTAYEIKTC